MRIRTNKKKWERAVLIVLGAASGTVLLLLFLLRLSLGGCRFTDKNAETSARTIRAAVQNWQSAESSVACPTIGQLVSEKHLDSDTSKFDPWGNPFELTCTDDEIYVASAGPDRKRGTADDIQIPKGTSSTR